VKNDEIMGVPDRSGYLMSFKPSGAGYITWDTNKVREHYYPAIERRDSRSMGGRHPSSKGGQAHHYLRVSGARRTWSGHQR